MNFEVKQPFTLTVTASLRQTTKMQEALIPKRKWPNLISEEGPVGTRKYLCPFLRNTEMVVRAMNCRTYLEQSRS